MGEPKRQPAIRVDLDGTVSLAPANWNGARVIVPQPGRTSGMCVEGGVASWEHPAPPRVYRMESVRVGLVRIPPRATRNPPAPQSDPLELGGNPQTLEVYVEVPGG